MSRPLNTFIIAGGSGERFWPMSRLRSPKHLVRLLSDTTLLAETVERAPTPDGSRLFILTNAAQIEPIRAALPDFPAERVIGEPAKRDTAPAAALATAIAYASDPSSMVALLPADAKIYDTAAFRKNFADAVDYAGREEAILTIGIPPSFPSTGFGYLHLGEGLATGPNGSEVLAVREFVEKPDLERAKEYVESGDYAWNAGMFVWRAELFLKEARTHAPELAAFIEHFPKEHPEAYLEEKFPELPKISVDYAIMERAARVCAVRAEFDWDDVGTWAALPAHLPQDDAHNTLRGKVVALDSRNNIVVSNGRTIALLGVEDLIVVETEDAILVCAKDRAQDVKKLHAQLDDDLK